MKKKQQYGQFFTTNYAYIMKGMYIPLDVSNIIEPFVGNGDILNFLDSDREFITECYDIDPKRVDTIQQDTLKTPPDYDDKFVITNPPYLARNKSTDKQLFDKYATNDLYKCFLKGIIASKCVGGIIIIPLNFWCSIRKADILLRKEFLEKFYINHLNIFEERVFLDTSYTVCCFQFEKRNDENTMIDITIYPTERELSLQLNKKNNYTFGGEIYTFDSKFYAITRLTDKNKNSSGKTNILVKCIDDNANSKIGLSIVSDTGIFIDTTPNLSSRTYASLSIVPEISLEVQEKLVERFNEYLCTHRDCYNSLFLTNYRESKDIARKRISFDLVYKIVGHLLDVMDVQ
jgi:hypothetical protein